MTEREITLKLRIPDGSSSISTEQIIDLIPSLFTGKLTDNIYRKIIEFCLIAMFNK